MNDFRKLLVLMMTVCAVPFLQAADPVEKTDPADPAEAGKAGKAADSSQEGGPYAHTNSKGKTYYLFSKDVQRKNSTKVQTIYYFAKDPKNSKGKPLAKVPKDRMVSETKTGMLVLKKKVVPEGEEKKVK